MQGAIFIGQIADTFVFSRREGVIVSPTEAWSPLVYIHDELQLVKPNGEVLTVKLGGIGMPNPSRFDGKNTFWLRAEGLSQDDVPIGSTLWLHYSHIKQPQALPSHT